ncbi:fimbrial protein [Pantoea ananatis]|uniref:fimbrial protein n=1 Tax=Pantoea ananas TaxID=553 RepID=UPI0021F7F7A5|nr:fimbrial protein [Pantoea ananatis]MCW0310485.1 Fimbria A protein [Pantoea ananatis]
MESLILFRRAGGGLLIAIGLTMFIALLVVRAKADAGSTDVVFRGTLLAVPCLVDMDSVDQTVAFSPVVARHFTNNHQSYPVDFSIALKACDLSVGSQVSVTFFGDKNAVNSALFALNGTVEGLGLAVNDGQGNVVLPGVLQPPVELTDTENRLVWLARLQRTAANGEVTLGEYSAMITFQLQYE